MKQLRLFNDQEWEIQPGERLATTPVLNSAQEKVANLVKPEEGRDQAKTQVKVLSPEIAIIMEAEAVRIEEGGMGRADKGEALLTPSGSKAMAGSQKESVGTGETQDVPRFEVCNNKPTNGQELQKTSWESDQLIVP
jgi:hypothetical protein